MRMGSRERLRRVVADAAIYEGCADVVEGPPLRARVQLGRFAGEPTRLVLLDGGPTVDIDDGGAASEAEREELAIYAAERPELAGRGGTRAHRRARKRSRCSCRHAWRRRDGREAPAARGHHGRTIGVEVSRGRSPNTSARVAASRSMSRANESAVDSSSSNNRMRRASTSSS
jgi:hypothetical protein